LVLEVKNQGMSSSECNKWVTDFSITHTLLRDNGQAQTALSLSKYDVLVMDRALTITYRGASGETSSTKTEVMAALANLMP